MKILKLLLLFCFTIQCIFVYGQNSLWLTNGKKIVIGEYKIQNKDYILYKTLKNKSKSIETFDVFSITDNTGNETLVYVKDTSFQGAFTVPEMRDFVQGQTDAILNFKSPIITTGGIVLMSATSVVINPIYVILLSGAYCSGIGITKTSEKRMTIPLEYKNNENYLLGYKKTCKHKRIKNAILGSGIGLVVGFTAFILINKN